MQEQFPEDKLGKYIHIGDYVLRAVISGKSPGLVYCEVTRVEGTKVWLDNSLQAIRFNNRLVIV